MARNTDNLDTVAAGRWLNGGRRCRGWIGRRTFVEISNGRTIETVEGRIGPVDR